MATSVINPNQIETKSVKYIQNKDYSPNSSNSPPQNESLLQEMEPNCSESNNNNNNNTNSNPKRGMTRSDTIETLFVDDGSVPLEVEATASSSEASPTSINSNKNKKMSNNNNNNNNKLTSNESDTTAQINKKAIISQYNRPIKWSVATERGYEKGPNKIRKPIHNFMEDFHFPTIDNKNAVVHTHPVSGLPVYIWLLADGHGGHEAPQFFIREMRTAVEDIIDFHDWNWDKREECQLFERFIKDKYKEVDKKFCDMKTKQFKAWKANGFNGEKPLDDGCTFIVNIIYKNMHINCNVGDSRTVLGKRDNVKRGLFSHRESVWSQVFGSRDHAPELSDMAYHISQNGGIFLNQNGSKRIHGAIVSPAKRGAKSYSDLVGTRIYRAVNQGISDIGISNMRTLNMGATMGDLLFKIEPAVLINEPDVTFNKLNTNKDYLLVIASDGVWDYLRYDYSVTQMNNNLLEYLGLSMTSYCQKKRAAEGGKVDKKNVNLNDITPEILEDIAKVIVQRDYVKDIYCQGLEKFDDCTAFLIFIPAINSSAKQNNL